MENKKIKVADAQGVEAAKEEIKRPTIKDGVMIENPAFKTTEKKRSSKSVSYALKAIAGHIGTIIEAGLLEKMDEEIIIEIHRRAAEAYMRKELGI